MFRALIFLYLASGIICGIGNKQNDKVQCGAPYEVTGLIASENEVKRGEFPW